MTIPKATSRTEILEDVEEPLPEEQDGPRLPVTFSNTQSKFYKRMEAAAAAAGQTALSSPSPLMAIRAPGTAWPSLSLTDAMVTLVQAGARSIPSKKTIELHGYNNELTDLLNSVSAGAASSLSSVMATANGSSSSFPPQGIFSDEMFQKFFMDNDDADDDTAAVAGAAGIFSDKNMRRSGTWGELATAFLGIICKEASSLAGFYYYHYHKEGSPPAPVTAGTYNDINSHNGDAALFLLTPALHVLGFDKGGTGSLKDATHADRAAKAQIDIAREKAKNRAMGFAESRGIPFTFERLVAPAITPDSSSTTLLPNPWKEVMSTSHLRAAMIRYITWTIVENAMSGVLAQEMWRTMQKNSHKKKKASSSSFPSSAPKPPLLFLPEVSKKYVVQSVLDGHGLHPNDSLAIRDFTLRYIDKNRSNIITTFGLPLEILSSPAEKILDSIPPGRLGEVIKNVPICITVVFDIEGKICSSDSSLFSTLSAQSGEATAAAAAAAASAPPPFSSSSSSSSYSFGLPVDLLVPPLTRDFYGGGGAGGAGEGMPSTSPLSLVLLPACSLSSPNSYRKTVVGAGFPAFTFIGSSPELNECICIGQQQYGPAFFPMAVYDFLPNDIGEFDYTAFHYIREAHRKIEATRNTLVPPLLPSSAAAAFLAPPPPLSLRVLYSTVDTDGLMLSMMATELYKTNFNVDLEMYILNTNAASRKAFKLKEKQKKAMAAAARAGVTRGTPVVTPPKTPGPALVYDVSLIVRRLNILLRRYQHQQRHQQRLSPPPVIKYPASTMAMILYLKCNDYCTNFLPYVGHKTFKEGLYKYIGNSGGGGGGACSGAAPNIIIDAGHVDQWRRAQKYLFPNVPLPENAPRVFDILALIKCIETITTSTRKGSRFKPEKIPDLKEQIFVRSLQQLVILCLYDDAIMGNMGGNGRLRSIPDDQIGLYGF